MNNENIITKLLEFIQANEQDDNEKWTCQSLNDDEEIEQVYNLFDSEQKISTEEEKENKLYFTFILLDNNKLLELVENGKHDSINRAQLFFGLIPNANLLTIETNNRKVKIINEKGISIHEGFDEVLVYPRELPEVISFEDAVKPTSIEQIISRGENRTRTRTDNHQ